MDSGLQFNYLSRPFLLGMLFRAFGEGLGEDSAELSGRRLENLNSQRTTLMLEVSGMKADVSVDAQRKHESAGQARDAELDLQIFNQENPPSTGKRGLFGRRRLSPEEQQTEASRLELEQILEDANEEASLADSVAAGTTKKLESLQADLEVIEQERELRSGELEARLAVDVIILLVESRGGEAADLVQRMRQLVRGSVVAGVLSVIVALFDSGKDAARGAIIDAAVLFEQSPEPLVRLLENLIVLTDGNLKKSEGIQVIRPGTFSVSGVVRLHQLVNVLSRGSVPTATESTDSFAPSIWVLARLMEKTGGVSGENYPALADWASSAELVVRTLACFELINSGNPGLVEQAAGIDWSWSEPAPRSQPTRPTLMEQITRIPTQAWPEPLIPEWQAALASIVLYACSQFGPEQTTDEWLEQSYGFEKSALYWWVLSQIKSDKSLLRNIDESPDSLFVPAQL